MKNLINTIIFLLISFGAVKGQNVSFTIKAIEGVPNKAKVYVKSNEAKTGVVTQTLVTFSLPATLDPKPNATFTSTQTFAHIGANTAVDVNTQMVNGISYFIYTFFSAYVGTVTNTFTANTEYEFGEVTFTNGNAPSTELRLVSLPNGGPNEISALALELGGVQIAIATGLTYGPGATNAANGYEGYSFVPLSNFTLPVNFLSFYALKNGDDAKLTWNVSNDEKNDYFEIQRSLDGRNFQSIQRINAASNGRTDNSYEAADLSLSKLGTREVFYQISQMDKDGMSTKSPVRKLSIDGLGKSVTAFPNPARTTTKLLVDAPEAGKGVISMYDNLGRQVQTMNAQFFKGTNQFDLNVMGLSSGDYNIQVRGAGLNETIKIAKIN